MNLGELKTFLVKTARAQPWGKMLLDWTPHRARFWDGHDRVVPRRLGAEIDLWRRADKGEGAAVYEAYQGGDVLDIGSFHGLYALVLAPKARPGSKFVCFEPDLRALATLQHNLGSASSLFPEIAFSALPWVAGDGQSIAADFPMGDGHPRFSSLESSASGPRSLRADDCVELLKIRPSFVKIDVEGAELAVLKGLERTLAELRPTLMLELHPKWQPPGSSVEAVLALLRSHGYTDTTLSVDDISIRQIWRAST